MPVNEVFLSFKDNIRKTRNPFFGTFIVVWVVTNWKFILTLFNLDLYPTMERKVEALKDYFVGGTLIGGFLLNAVITLGVLIVTYGLLNLSKAIVLTFENHVSPWVQKKLDPNSIVPKTDLEVEKRRVAQLELRLSEERARRVRVEQERDDLEKRLSIPADPVMESPFVAIDKMLGPEGQTEFLDLVTIIRKGDSILEDDDVTKFLQSGLIHVQSKTRSSVRYNLTKKGDQYCDYLLTKLSAATMPPSRH